MRRDDLIPIGSPRPAALVALAVWSLLGARVRLRPRRGSPGSSSTRSGRPPTTASPSDVPALTSGRSAACSASWTPGISQAGNFVEHVPPPRIQQGRGRPDRVGMGRTPTSPPANCPSISGSPGPGRRSSHNRAARPCCGGPTTRTGLAAQHRPDCSPVSRLGHVPKMFETFGSAEFWGLRMSPGCWWGPPPTETSRCRRTSAAITSPARHTAEGGEGSAPIKASARFELADNPNPQTETMRALLVALIDWVVNETEPPPSGTGSFRRVSSSALITARWVSPRSPARRSRTTC